MLYWVSNEALAISAFCCHDCADLGKHFFISGNTVVALVTGGASIPVIGVNNLLALADSSGKNKVIDRKSVV